MTQTPPINGWDHPCQIYDIWPTHPRALFSSHPNSEICRAHDLEQFELMIVSFTHWFCACPTQLCDGDFIYCPCCCCYKLISVEFLFISLWLFVCGSCFSGEGRRVRREGNGDGDGDGDWISNRCEACNSHRMGWFYFYYYHHSGWPLTPSSLPLSPFSLFCSWFFC